MNSIKIIIIFFFISGFAYAQNETPKDSISNKLKEVVIDAKTKTFTNKNGNIKVDVANSIYNSIPNTLDLLSKLPKVLLSPNKENISIVGKGTPLIYIDNQKVGINDLNALSVDDIKSIEIIQNPSVKYEADGRAVILITRKFSKKEGFKTILSETASFKKDFNNYIGFNSSFKKGKLEWKANFNYNQLQPWEYQSVDYAIPSASIVSNYDVDAFTKRKQFVFGGSMFYKINEDDYLSFTVSSKLQGDTFGINSNTYNKKEDVINNVLTYTDNDNNKDFVNSFLNYSKKIKSIDTQIFTGILYSNFNQGLFSEIENNYNNTEFELTQIRDQKFKVDFFSGRVDIEKKFKNEMLVEIGGLYSSANSKSDFDIFSYDTNQNIRSHYDFKEQNLAGYGQLSGKINKIDFAVGLRVENTNANGKYKTDVTPLIEKNYTNFFPKVEFTFPIDSTKSISVNYSKSISRPNYSSLSQGTTYINPYFVYARNINIDPTFNNEISTVFQYHDKSVKLGYYRNINPVYSSFSYDKEQNILTFKDVNFDRESGFSVDFTLPFSYKFWTTTNSLIFILEKIEDKSALFLSSKPHLFYYSSNEFKLPKGYTFSVFCWGITKQNIGILEKNERFVMDMGLSKTFFKNWNCTLSFNNVFNDREMKEQFVVNNINSQTRYLLDSQEISFAVKYSFGKMKDTEFKGKSIDDSGRIR
ncbi:TonB-dependent receptor [Flavobacterium branchiarum]|uniref:TonB-dependent receptor domain-containing protein n=1 Tax=Flavobacterium branchiarum TaxID=1114870 RepID=A0ABV5FP96_9FLAO|nr:TonB-dependent receptor [Flavobacterium branchiarum]MDN3672748.1 TonB-dependent receptor [Flavobacterium branchiarum]